MADPLEMSLDEYIKKKQIRVRDPMRNGRRQQGSPRSYRSRGDSGWNQRQFGRKWRYEDDNDEEEEENGFEEEEMDDSRWQDKRYNRRNNHRLDDNENRRWILAARRQQSPGLKQDNAQQQGESKLFLYNLHSDVTNNDLKELFSALGTVKEVTVHYDRLGRSTGSADLVYEKRSNALRAIREYNEVPLDGLQMKIELLRSAEELGIPRIGSQRQKAMAKYRRER
ncbi:uncharacterized protein [Halyomorpha halys]|uniref:uncharacterized protein n=1 Tax=Halyomorpha halys TaxID=286706 RepID=UPI0006D4E1E7|nr:THO complex subunit 4B [Halyomorpha halys]